MIVFIIIILIILIAIMLHSYIKIDITRYDIKDDKIDKNMKIVLLSDLHNRNMTKSIKTILDNENPDLIILSGDMVNNYPKESKNFIKLVSILKKYKTFYTFGNHEEIISTSNNTRFLKKLFDNNINVLNDMKNNLTLNIRLCGICVELTNTFIKKNKKINKEYIYDKIGDINEENFNILIAHNPFHAQYFDEYGFDLILSGHIHGGVIKIPYFGGLLSPDYTFFPKYCSGIYELNKSKLIVSRGLGFSKRIPFRIFNPAEVVVINLMKSK